MTLSANGICIKRGARTILSHISASFKSSQFSVILGPNGAGKSTLLNALSGLLQLSSGVIQIDGTDLTALTPKARARQIGLLPQSAETHWSISGDALVALGRYPHQRGWGVSSTDRAAIDEAMALTDTLQFADRPVNSLSGGERARVLMARVLAGEPQWILADEPLANLDPGHQVDMLHLLRTEAEKGRGVVAVLHDLGSALRFADHIVMLHEGRVFADGAPKDVITPVTLREVYGVSASIWDSNVTVTGRAKTDP